MLAKTAGPFITSLNLTGHTRLAPTTLDSIAEHLCLYPAPSHTLPHTQLTEISLQGCSSVTTRPFHRLLRCSPMLERLNAKGLKAVTNVTLDVLSTSAPLITHLNLLRCVNVDAGGLRSYFTAVMDREETLRLRDLGVSGLRRMDNDVMEKMGRTCLELEVLDPDYGIPFPFAFFMAKFGVVPTFVLVHFRRERKTRGGRPCAEVEPLSRICSAYL